MCRLVMMFLSFLTVSGAWTEESLRTAQCADVGGNSQVADRLVHSWGRLHLDRYTTTITLLPTKCVPSCVPGTEGRRAFAKFASALHSTHHCSRTVQSACLCPAKRSQGFCCEQVSNSAPYTASRSLQQNPVQSARTRIRTSNRLKVCAGLL